MVAVDERLGFLDHLNYQWQGIKVQLFSTRPALSPSHLIRFVLNRYMYVVLGNSSLPICLRWT